MGRWASPEIVARALDGSQSAVDCLLPPFGRDAFGLR